MNAALNVARRILAAWLALAVLALAAPEHGPESTALGTTGPAAAVCHCQVHVEIARAAARLLSFEDACAPAPAHAAAVTGVPLAPPVSAALPSAPQSSGHPTLVLDGVATSRTARPEAPPPRDELSPA
jgi:hypothetical protein